MSFNPMFEYRVTWAKVPDDFPEKDEIAEQLAQISPKPPKGRDDWQLVSSTSVVTAKGPVIIYTWERPTDAQPK